MKAFSKGKKFALVLLLFALSGCSRLMTVKVSVSRGVPVFHFFDLSGEHKLSFCVEEAIVLSSTGEVEWEIMPNDTRSACVRRSEIAYGETYADLQGKLYTFDLPAGLHSFYISGAGGYSTKVTFAWKIHHKRDLRSELGQNSGLAPTRRLASLP